MDSAEVGKYIESVAVRIAFHNGNSVAGTGVLYTLQAQKRAVVLTAGHVLQSALTNSHICPAVFVRLERKRNEGNFFGIG